MSAATGTTLDPDAVEKRRREAIRLVIDKRLSQSAAARRLQIARQTISRWIREYRKAGAASRNTRRAGRKPRLTDEQRQQIIELLRQGPERLGYRTSQWTCPRVAYLIVREFGVRYHAGHVWKLLRSLGWSRPAQVPDANEVNGSPSGHREEIHY
jgi:transposase